MSAQPGEAGDLMTRLAEYEAVLAGLLGVLEAGRSTDENFTQAAERLAQFGPLVEELKTIVPSEGEPRSAELEARLKTVRLQHGLLFQAGTRQQDELTEALGKVREVRRTSNLYSATDADTGVSCDISG